MADIGVKLDKVFYFTEFVVFYRGDSSYFSNIQDQIGLKYYLFHLVSAC